MKYLVLSKSVTAWELSKENLESNNHKLDDYINAQRELASKFGMEHLYTESTFTEQVKHSIGRCSSCSDWTMDRNTNPIKDDDLESIKDGATIEGNLLCYECLPSGHRWSWS